MEDIHLEKNHRCEYKRKHSTSIVVVHLDKDEFQCNKTEDGLIFFVLDGRILFHNNILNNINIGSNSIFLLPADTEYKLVAETDSTFIIYKIDTHTRIAQNHFFDRLIGSTSLHKTQGLFTLPIKSRVLKHLELQQNILEDGIECKCLLELRKKELFYLLKAYYSKQDLHQLFSPILSKDIGFTSLVSAHFMTANNIQELAKLCNYSLSGFIKRFHKTFEVSPYKWIKEQKANRILYELQSTNKSFKEICYEFGFGSLSYFHAFCKREFGTTPKKIRNESLPAKINDEYK